MEKYHLLKKTETFEEINIFKGVSKKILWKIPSSGFPGSEVTWTIGTTHKLTIEIYSD